MVLPFCHFCRSLANFYSIFSLEAINTWHFVSFQQWFIKGITMPARDYSIPGFDSARFFSTISAVASLLFIYNTGMLPELQVSTNIHCLVLFDTKSSYMSHMLQATLRPPVVTNMKKALWFQFTIGSFPLYAVIFIGYWAYGSSTSSYLLNNTKGPIWIKAVANLSAFLQTVISLHVSHNWSHFSPVFCFHR